MLTDEQRDAVRCSDDLMLTACPGSGKTRVIISKLARVIDEIRDTPRAVACITYTNTAVQEIEARLRFYIQPGDDAYFDICTIYSFCLNHIFRPFCHIIKGYKNGFKVLTPESAEFERLVTAVCAQHNRYNLTYKDFEDFTQLRVSLDGKPVNRARCAHACCCIRLLETYPRRRVHRFCKHHLLLACVASKATRNPELYVSQIRVDTR